MAGEKPSDSIDPQNPIPELQLNLKDISNDTPESFNDTLVGNIEAARDGLISYLTANRDNAIEEGGKKNTEDYKKDLAAKVDAFITDIKNSAEVMIKLLKENRSEPAYNQRALLTKAGYNFQIVLVKNMGVMQSFVPFKLESGYKSIDKGIMLPLHLPSMYERPKKDVSDWRTLEAALYLATLDKQKAERAPIQDEAVPVSLSQVALIGDSIGVGIEQLGFAALTDGKGRETLAKKNALVFVIGEEIANLNPTKTPYLIIQGGTNNLGDTSKKNAPESTADELIKVYELAIKQGFKKENITLTTIPPHKNKEGGLPYADLVTQCNEYLKKKAAEKGFRIFDLHAACVETMKDENENKRFALERDGIHPTSQAYKVMGEILASKTFEGKFAPKAEEKNEDKLEKENPAKAVHTKYLGKIKEIKEKDALDDETAIKGSTILDLRKNASLLSKAEGKDGERVANLKEETTRRIKAYTSDQTEEWYTLNYTKFGKDKTGKSHELNVGLGDILLDTDIQEILVKRGNEVIKGTRAIVKGGKHAGRVGFVDNQGEYIATLTGDQFRILSDAEIDPSKPDPVKIQEYIKKVEPEDKARENAQVIISQEESYGGSVPNVKELEALALTQESNLKADKSVAEQIKIKLTTEQRANAEKIEKEFIAAGLNYPNLIAAAIVNSYKESSLDAKVIGKEIDPKTGAFKGNSVGLFQLYDHGVGIRNGKTMSIEERQDPAINTRRMIEHMKSIENGRAIISEAKAGASVQELTRLFCVYLEVPANREVRGKERAVTSLAFFDTKPIEQITDTSRAYAKAEGTSGAA